MRDRDREVKAADSIRRYCNLHLGSLLRLFLGAIALGTILGWELIRSPEWLTHPVGAIAQQIHSGLEDPATQCVIAALLHVLLFSMLGLCLLRALEFRRAALVLLLAIAAFHYWWRFMEASKELECLVLFSAVAIWQAPAWRRSDTASAETKLEITLLVFVAVILVGAILGIDRPPLFQYRSDLRWVGAWNSPNTFGILVGVGLLISTGRLLVEFSKSVPAAFRLPSYTLCCLSAVCTFFVVALLKSYSRGAWLGVACGVAFAVWNCRRAFGGAVLAFIRKRVAHFGGNLMWTAALMASSALLSLFLLQQTQVPLFRRLFSVLNQNDFSWMNRVEVWRGALQMLGDRPLTGYGWGSGELVYAVLYSRGFLDEAMSVQWSEYLRLGVMLGLPALFLFLAHVWLTLVEAPLAEQGGFHISSVFCRAAAIVILVGFWFDGGLFNISIAVPFWGLLELGRANRGASWKCQPDPRVQRSGAMEASLRTIS